MSEYKFTDEIIVKEVQQMGSDSMVVAAARVSTSGEEALSFVDKEANRGIINYLMQHRHGTPFEQGALTVFVKAPIMVWREWHRHRIGFSYNEESGRYKQLNPEFWIPSPDRLMEPVPEQIICEVPGCNKELHKLNNGTKVCKYCHCSYSYHTSARPLFRSLDKEVHSRLVERMKESYIKSYETYEENMKDGEFGVAKEVCRATLPVGIYSSCWVTCNPRSIMSFLSLRVHDPEAKFVSYPQLEIQNAAKQLEKIFATHWPITHECFINNGRVGP